MIRTHFWPSNSCDKDNWDLAINKALELQSIYFPKLEICTTKIHNRKFTFHVSTAIEIAEYMILNRGVPTIHFIQLSSNDIQEEHRDAFPESILHLDIIARLSRTNAIVILDLLGPDLIPQRRQLESVTFVEKTCTLVKEFPRTYPRNLPLQPKSGDYRKLNQLTYTAINLLRKNNNPNQLSTEP